MFQHYQSVFQLSPPRAHSCSLYLTHLGQCPSLAQSISPPLSLSFAQISRVNLNGLACVYGSCIVIHSVFRRWYGFSSMFRP